MRSTMINAIGAMHATMLAKKQTPEEKVNFRVEVKKRRRPRQDGDGHVDPRRHERGDKRGVTT